MTSKALQNVKKLRTEIEDVATLLADTTLTYGSMSAGDTICTRAESFSYEIAASNASDHNLTTAGGLKLYVLPSQVGGVPAQAINNDIQGALNAASDVVYVPEGVHTAQHLVIDKSLTIIGKGRALTTINLTGYTTYDGVKAAIVSKGNSSQGLGSTVQIKGIYFNIQNTEPNVNGALITRKQYWTDVDIRNATGNGILLRSINVNTEAPYFCRFESVWSKQNGESGLRITDNCNANMFVNCQFDANGDHGVVQILIGLPGINQAVYNNVFIGGQASYNQKHGLFFQNGANCQIVGTYCEYNSQVDGGDPKVGAYKNLQLGPTVTRMHISLGEQGTDTNLDQLVGLNTVTNNFVSIGGFVLTPVAGLSMGYPNVGTGRNLDFYGAGGSVHNITFHEGLSAIFHMRYNGVPGNPDNEIQFVPVNGGVEGTPQIRMRNNGRLGFFGVTPVDRQTVAAAASDAATTQTLVNDIRAKLIALGLVQ